MRTAVTQMLQGPACLLLLANVSLAFRQMCSNLVTVGRNQYMKHTHATPLLRHACRLHRKDLAATNQATRRQQHSTLDDMEAQLALLQQQIDIERSVHTAAVEFLGSREGLLQEDAVSWHSRREEDGRAKERALEVRARLPHDVPNIATLPHCAHALQVGCCRMHVRPVQGVHSAAADGTATATMQQCRHSRPHLFMGTELLHVGASGAACHPCS